MTILFWDLLTFSKLESQLKFTVSNPFKNLVCVWLRVENENIVFFFFTFLHFVKVKIVGNFCIFEIIAWFSLQLYVISEVIFIFEPSTKKNEPHQSQGFFLDWVVEGQWFGSFFLRMGPNWKYLLRLPNIYLCHCPC